MPNSNKYFLSWYLFICINFYLLIFFVIVRDFVKIVSAAIRLQLIQVSLFQFVQVKISDEYASIFQPHLSLTVWHCMILNSWAKQLGPSHICLFLKRVNESKPFLWVEIGKVTSVSWSSIQHVAEGPCISVSVETCEGSQVKLPIREHALTFKRQPS